jgi:hypothetical protein
MKQLVYDNIIPSWGTKQIPEWWKWKTLCLKPKNPDRITPDTLRPLVLVEVLRKIWIGLIIQQINNTWARHGILHTAQHGFRPKRGTDTALFQLQTTFEQSAIDETPLYLSSWDISKAFDSLSKNTLRFAWTRLGVPTELADLLVSLDEEGHNIVNTPYSQEQWLKHGYKGFTTPLLYFTGERGAGQGDVGSPLNWIAAFDILLCALSSVDEGHFYIRRHNNILTPAHDIAYADDLISGRSTLLGLQHKADIVSAFSIIFGLDIATDKLRTFLHFPTGIIPPSAQHQTIKIHTTGWNLQPITVATSETLKVLGKLYDISSPNLHESQFKLTLQQVNIGAHMITRARGDTHMRRMALCSFTSTRAQ